MDDASIPHTSPSSVSPNKCTSCERTYTTKRSLIRHRRSSIKCFSGAGPIVRHFCPYCPDTFARPDNVQKHIRRAHLSLQEALSFPNSGALDLFTSDTGTSISPQSQGSTLGSTVASPAGPSTPDTPNLLSRHHHISCWTEWSVEALFDTNSAISERDTLSGYIDTWAQEEDIFGQHDVCTEYNTGGSLENVSQQWICNDSILGPSNTGSSQGATTQDVGNFVDPITASMNLSVGLSMHALQDAVCLAVEQDQPQNIQALRQQYTSFSASTATDSATETGSDLVYLHQSEEPYLSPNSTLLQSPFSTPLAEAASADVGPYVPLLLDFGASASTAPELTAAEAGSLAISELLLEDARISQLGSMQLGSGLRAAAIDHLQEIWMNDKSMMPLNQVCRCATCDAMHSGHETKLNIHHS